MKKFNSYLLLNTLIVFGLYFTDSCFAADIEEGMIDIPQETTGHSSPEPNGKNVNRNKIEENEIPVINNPSTSNAAIEEITINVPNSDKSPEKEPQTLANNQLEENSEDEEGYIGTTTNKLGGGVLDIATSWLELPKTIVKVTKEDGIASGLTIGIAKGIANTAEQAVNGAVNVATFPVPKKVDIDIVENPGDEFNMEETFGSAFKRKKESDDQ